jgi:hypothetical protein
MSLVSDTLALCPVLVTYHSVAVDTVMLKITATPIRGFKLNKAVLS